MIPLLESKNSLSIGHCFYFINVSRRRLEIYTERALSYIYQMISREEILGLAGLARIKVTDAEVKELQKDISNILEYVGQVSAVQGNTSPQAGEKPPLIRNVMREDILYEGTLVSGKREQLLAALPKREGDFLVVRKIIEKDAP